MGVMEEKEHLDALTATRYLKTHKVREHFKIPMACTSAVWNEVAEAVTRYGKDYEGVLHDLCWLARLQIGKGTGGSTLRFRCIVGVKERGYKLICGPGDDPRPVLTLLKENED
jgi:hypothetical protein